MTISGIGFVVSLLLLLSLEHEWSVNTIVINDIIRLMFFAIIKNNLLIQLDLFDTAKVRSICFYFYLYRV